MKVAMSIVRFAISAMIVGYLYQRVGWIMAVFAIYVFGSLAIDLILINRAHRNILQMQTNQAEILRTYLKHMKNYHKGQLNPEQLAELDRGIDLLEKEKQIAIKSL